MKTRTQQTDQQVRRLRVVDRRRWRAIKRTTCGVLLVVSFMLSGSSGTGFVGWLILACASALACNIYRDEWD